VETTAVKLTLRAQMALRVIDLLAVEVYLVEYPSLFDEAG
jgi:hypothetical protein